MRLIVDGAPCDIEQGQSILDAVIRLGLDELPLEKRPLAAQIGGEIFSLNYLPYRDVDIRLLRYGDEEGRRVYERTLQFICIASINKLFPKARVFICYSLGAGLYVTIEKQEPLTQEDVLAIERKMRRMIEEKIPLVRKRLPIDGAISYFEKEIQNDKADLLKWRKFTYFDVYSIDGYMDYYYGEMAPDTGYANVFGLEFLNDGALLLLMPRANDPDTASQYKPQAKLEAVYRESEKWNSLMECSTANDLNTHVTAGTIRELIRVNEALHEKSYAHIADMIVAKKARAVLVAGPSCSGKTTSANRIATQLRVLGQHPVMLSLDNYYADRDAIPVDENGERDFEHINTLDIRRFNHDLALLMRGEEAEVPLFDFTVGARRSESMLLKLKSDQPLIIEGIHGLNPLLLKGDSIIDEEHLFRVYVSALTTLNLDDHNRIRTTDVRLLRRLVRDNFSRATPVEETMAMWQSVRRGEEKWIFPFQENADIFFNTTLVYEIAVVKKYIYPLLMQVPKSSKHFASVRNLVKFLNYFLDADVEDEIPPTSILREFVGGNTFYR